MPSSSSSSSRSILASLLVMAMLATSVLRISPALNATVMQQRQQPDASGQQAALAEAARRIEAGVFSSFDSNSTATNGSTSDSTSAATTATASTTSTTTGSTTSGFGPGSRYPYAVLYCLSGDHPGFLSEFQSSLKSVLMNAPLEAPLDLYILADQKAFEALQGQVMNETQLALWRTRNPIRFHTYNVQSYEGPWTDRIIRFWNSSRAEQIFSLHSIGAYFRLLAKDVLPSHVSKILYLDPDAILMANLQSLWHNLDVFDDDKLFYWGQSMCSGFMVLDVQQLEEVWSLAAQTNITRLVAEQKLDTFGKPAVPYDQNVFRAVNLDFPDRVGVLDTAWDINVADGAWLFRKELVKHRPKLGMIHFNGAGGSKESAFETHNFLTSPNVPKETWGLALYYAHMPWDWARYWTQSMIPHPIVPNKSNKDNNTNTDAAQIGHPLVLQWYDVNRTTLASTPAMA